MAQLKTTRPRAVTASRATLPQLLRGIFADEMHQVISEFRHRPVADAAVHDLRKLLKRSRATLRLMRDYCGPDVYHDVNSMLRDVARPLTPARDARMLVETLDALKLKQEGEIQRVRRRLRAELLRSRQQKLHSLAGLKVLPTARFTHAAHRIEDAVSGSAAQRAELGSGLIRIYRKGRQSFGCARAHPTDLNLHEWRKQAKYLGLALQILNDVTYGRFARLQKSADRLAQLLGGDHDLAILRRTVNRGGSGVSIQQRIVRRLVRAIDRRRGRLQRKAYRRGRRLYRARPKQLRQWLKLWIG